MQIKGTPLIILLTGPCGAGKTTIEDMLRKDLPHAISPISDTTRGLRSYETQGVDFNFIDKGEFMGRLDTGNYLEHANVHGELYGTNRQPVVDALKEGKDSLLVINVDGASQVRDYMKVNPELELKYIDFFIVAPSYEELRRRVEGDAKRGTISRKDLDKRMENAKIEMTQKDKFMHIVMNEEIERAYSQIYKTIQNHRELISN